jgi:multiple sugar transport system substrate-binding protein
MGGEHAFEPVAWHSANRSLHGQVWAIPWTADPRVLFYWQDMLDSAGIEETTAFQSPIQMELTLERLQSSGIATPWVLPTAFPLAAVQTAASWIWGAGGEIARQDGKRTLFCEAPALEGLQRYYSLYRFMPLIGQLISDLQALELFINRQAAVTMGSLYLGTQILAQAHPEHLSMLGTALPPGPALVGGSNLVVWAHTQSQPEAAALIVFLTSPALMSFHCQRTGYLPTRLDVLNSSPFNTDPRFKAYAQALQSGKPFPIIKAGGLLENSLASSLVNIWIDILRSGGGNIRSFLEKHLVPLGRRLDITLSQFE